MADTQHWVHPKTSLAGFSACGLMSCGIYGVIEIPDDIDDPIPGIHHEYIPFRLYIGGADKSDIFIKGSLQWSMTIDDAVSSCSFSVYDSEPDRYDQVVIKVGVSNTTLWRGMVLSVSSSYIGGDSSDNTAVYQYDVDCVSREFMFSRKYISRGFKGDTYAGYMVKKIYNKYIGTYAGWVVNGYKYENPVKYENEDIMSIFQKLAGASDCYFYIDPMSNQFYFLESGNKQAKINMTYEASGVWDIETNKWGFPRNNYHNTGVTRDASNVATKVIIHGKKPVKHTITNYGQDYLNENYELKFGNANEQYFVITEGQATFFTPNPIYCVDKIEADWTYYAPNLAAPWEGPLEQEKSKTWYNPMGSSHPVHLAGQNQVGGEDQWEKILGVAPENLIDDEGNPIEVEEAYYKKTSRGFWENNMDLEDPEDVWEEDTAPKYTSWELRPELSNQSTYTPAITASENDGYTPAFVFDVGYDSNTVTFKAPIDIGVEELKVSFDKVKITYYEMVDEKYIFTHGNKNTYASRSGTDGIFELHIEDPSIFKSSIASKYASRIFELHSVEDVSASYTYYVRGLDIINDKIYAGQRQTVHFHGGQYSLLIESVSWSLFSMDPLLFKVDVSLGTKIRDLSQLLADVLS